VAEKTGLERTHLYRKLKQLGVDLSRAKKTASNWAILRVFAEHCTTAVHSETAK
jgi:hypothetical protein